MEKKKNVEAAEKTEVKKSRPGRTTMATKEISKKGTPEYVERKWYLVDAAGLPLGRVASQVAAVLRGKNKPQFTPNVDCGDFVIVINCDKVILTGNKLEGKYYRTHSGYMGGLKEIQYKQFMAESSDKAMYVAVKGMLPKNSLGRQMLKKLRVYKDAEYGHEAQKPVALEITK